MKYKSKKLVSIGCFRDSLCSDKLSRFQVCFCTVDKKVFQRREKFLYHYEKIEKNIVVLWEKRGSFSRSHKLREFFREKDIILALMDNDFSYVKNSLKNEMERI